MRKITGYTVLGALGWLLIVLLVQSLLDAWILSKLWSWLVAAQYGSGPFFGSWFGLAIIARMVLREGPSIQDLESEPTVDDVDFGKRVRRSITIWCGELVTLGLAWCVGSVFGWIS